MMSTEMPNAYLQTKVMTANPAELRLMLIEGAIKFIAQGREGLENRDFESAYNGISRGQAIIMELLNGLRPEHDPDLCRRLSELYTFMYLELVKGLSEKNAEQVRAVEKLLEFERETWVQLIERLAQENACAGTMTDTPDVAESANAAHAAAPPSDLIGGSVSVTG